MVKIIVEEEMGALPPSEIEDMTPPQRQIPKAPPLPVVEPPAASLPAATEITTDKILEQKELAKLAGNLAISRGISPSASWIWKLGGMPEDPSFESVKTDTGWTLNFGDNTFTSPEGIVYSYEEYQSLYAEEKAKIAKAQEILRMTLEEQLAALKENFPELYVMPQRPQDGTGRMRTNYGGQFIQPEDVPAILAKYLDERKSLITDLGALAGAAIPDKQKVDEVVRQILADPQEFLDSIRNTPRTKEMDALLDAAMEATGNRALTEDEKRAVYGLVPILPMAQFFMSKGQSEEDAKKLAAQLAKFEDMGITNLQGNLKDLKKQYDDYVAYMNDDSVMATIGKGLGQGAGQVLALLAAGNTWLGDQGIAKKLGIDGWFKERAERLQNEIAYYSPYMVDDMGPFSWEQLFNWRFYAVNLSTQAPLQIVMLPLTVASGGGAGAVVAKIGLNRFASTMVAYGVSGTVNRLQESGLEAAGAYDAYLKLHPGDSIGAKHAGDKTFINNMKLTGFDIVEIAAMFAPPGTKGFTSALSKGFVSATRNAAGRIITITVTSAGEEVIQELIYMDALGDKKGVLEKLKDPAIKTVAAVGGMLGLVQFGVGSVSQSFVENLQNRYVKSLPPQSKQLYDEAHDTAIMSGATEAEAAQTAVDEVAGTPEGAKVAQALAETLKVESYQEAIKPKTETDRVAFDSTFAKQKADIQAQYPDVEVAEAVKESELYRTTRGFEEDAALRTELETEQGYKLYAVFETPEAMQEASELLMGQDLKFVKHISTTGVPTWEIYAKTLSQAKVPVETTDLQALHDANPVLFNNAQRAKTVDEFIEKMSKGKPETVSIPVLTDFYNKVHTPTPKVEPIKGAGPGTPSINFFTPKTGKDLTSLKLELVDYIKKNLPKASQGQMLTDVAKIETDSDFDKAVTKVNKIAEAYNNAQYKRFLEKNGLNPENIKPQEPLPIESIKKFVKLIEMALPARSMTESMKHAELSKRAAALRDILESNVGYDAYKKSLASLKGELPQADYILDLAGAGMTQEDIQNLWEAVRKSNLREFQKLNTFKALDDLLVGKLPTTGELVNLEKVFGRELAEALMKKMSFGNKLWAEIVSILNLPRAVITSIDNSFILRQGGMLAWRNIPESIDALKSSFKAMFSEKNALEVIKSIESNPYFPLLQDSGLYQAPHNMATAQLSEREEAFMTRFAEKLPFVKWSARAYITGLNKLRADVFYKWVKYNEARNPTMGEYKAIANTINVLSGRGNLGVWSDKALALSSVAFAPRYLVSRVQAPMQLFSKYPSVRKMAAQNLAAWFAMNMIFLGLIKAAGGTIEDDPRSSDFGKGRLGNTRLDFWAGEVQWARMLAQIVSGQRKQLESGAVTDANRFDTFMSFVRSKASPLSGLIWDLMVGETAIGDEMSLANAPTMLKERLVPLFLQDLWDAVRDQGLAGGLEAIPGFFGVGVQTFGGQTWTGMENKLGLPVTTDLPSTGKQDIYGTDNMYSDAMNYLRDVPTKDVLANPYFPPEAGSIAQARDIKNLINEMPNVALYKLADVNSHGDSIEQFYAQWQMWLGMKDDQKAQDAFKAKYGKSFQEAYPDYEKGNITRNEYTLIKQYKALAADEAKEAFLKAHPELNTNPRESYLISHPQENALLALWGQANVLTQSAYNALVKLKTELDIPDSALSNKIPTEKVAKSYFNWLDLANKWGTSSPEAKLARLNDTELEKWGETNLNWSPVTSNKLALDIMVKYRTEFDMYDAFSDEDSPFYIAALKERGDAQDAYLKANPEFRNQKYLATGLGYQDKQGNYMPMELALMYVAYRNSVHPDTYRKTTGKALDLWMVANGKWQGLDGVSYPKINTAYKYLLSGLGEGISDTFYPEELVRMGFTPEQASDLVGMFDTQGKLDMGDVILSSKDELITEIKTLMSGASFSQNQEGWTPTEIVDWFNKINLYNKFKTTDAAGASPPKPKIYPVGEPIGTLDSLEDIWVNYFKQYNIGTKGQKNLSGAKIYLATEEESKDFDGTAWWVDNRIGLSPRLMASSPEEIIGIVAHEIAHHQWQFLTKKQQTDFTNTMFSPEFANLTARLTESYSPGAKGTLPSHELYAQLYMNTDWMGDIPDPQALITQFYQWSGRNMTQFIRKYGF